MRDLYEAILGEFIVDIIVSKLRNPEHKLLTIMINYMSPCMLKSVTEDILCHCRAHNAVLSNSFARGHRFAPYRAMQRSEVDFGQL